MCDKPDKPDTHFAPAAREPIELIQQEVETVSHSPILSALLESVSGLLAILNDKRQIIALNDSLLDELEIRESEGVLGLRLGEVLKCKHAHEMKAGCGTSKYCSTCGAVIAMVSALESKKATEKYCSIETTNENDDTDLFFKIKACPIEIENETYVLLFLQDHTKEQQWNAMDKVFFHDIKNVLGAVKCQSMLISMSNEKDEELVKLSDDLSNVIDRLADEISIHQVLCEGKKLDSFSSFHDVTIATVVKSLEELFTNHPTSVNRHLEVNIEEAPPSIITNQTLLLRVLTNMLTNAFEACAEGTTVRLTVQKQDKTTLFDVWNESAIPSDIARRIFQRNFSTKDQMGRGLGTYSMKVFGERVLGGKISFETSPDAGTTFRLALPLRSI